MLGFHRSSQRVMHTARAVVFENAAHDFPKQIAYRLDGDQLEVTTSGDGRDIIFRFERVAEGNSAR